MVRQTIAHGVSIESGSLIELGGRGDGHNEPQIDYVEFIPLQPRSSPIVDESPIEDVGPPLSSEDLLAGVRTTAQSYLRSFLEFSNVSEQLTIAFGEHYDATRALSVLDDWVYGNGLSELSIELVEGFAYHGAYAPETETVYLSYEFVFNTIEQPEKLAAVVLQELGHWLDGAVNVVDSAGDEGSIFAALVMGEELDAARLSELRSLSDHSHLELGEESIALELSSSPTVITGSAGNDTLTGNSQANALYGKRGNDILRGRDGRDSLYGEGGNDSLYGGNHSDTLIGDRGNDFLNGEGGADTLKGGTGNDTYVIGPGDLVVEQANEGRDLVKSPMSYTLLNNVNLEDLTLTGGNSINGTGNHLPNTITGNSGTNRLYGLDGNDKLWGHSGHDYLDGGTGVDSLYGGHGNDTYVVDESSDWVSEYAGSGTDTVQSSASYTLSNKANIEHLTLTGSASINGTGNGLANTIKGNSGNNRLSGLDGKDKLWGYSGHDYLDGGTGVDSLYGGHGNDTYVVDDSRDWISEYEGSGIDTVQSSASYTLSNKANIEHLTLTGSASINGTGNGLANTIKGNSGANTLNGDGGNDRLFGEGGADVLRGGAGLDQLHGADGADALYGDSGNDSLWGDAGNDRLDGGTGADALFGGAGNDTYIVDHESDSVLEGANGGIDTVQTHLDYDLPSGVEHLILTGSGDVTGTGNQNNNSLTGNGGANHLAGQGGNDILRGGAGHDTLQGASWRDGDRATQIDDLTGGAGADRFVIHESAGADQPYDGSGYVIIRDFEAGVDTIQLAAHSDGYRLAPVNQVGNGTVMDTGIFYQDDLVAVIQDSSDIALEDDGVFVDVAGREAGILNFAQSQIMVNESDGTAEVTIQRTGGAQGEVKVHLSSSNGSAVEGEDYEKVSQTITLADGETERTVSLSITDDSEVEADEQFQLILGTPNTPGWAVVGEQRQVEVTIASDDIAPPPPTVYNSSHFTVSGFETVDTAHGPVLQTTDDGVAALTFEGETGYYDVSINTAEPAQGSVVLSATVAGAGEVWTLSASSDNGDNPSSDENRQTQQVARQVYLETGDEIQIGGTASQGGVAQIESVELARVLDPSLEEAIAADGATYGRIGFEAVSYRFDEAGDTTATVTLVRDAGIQGTVSVQVISQDLEQTGESSETVDKAVASEDYTPIDQTVTFGDQETSKTIVVKITKDSIEEGDEAFSLKLQNTKGGAELGEKAQANLTINGDRDLPSVISVATESLSVDESAGTVDVSLTRSGSLDGEVSVQVSSEAISAADGSDYDGVAQTVTFGDGESSQTVTVAIRDDVEEEATETFAVGLSAPSDGATLGDASRTTVSITDDDTPAETATFDFEEAAYTVSEDGETTAEITVVRSGSTDEEMSVRVVSEDGTGKNGAIALEDYETVDEVLTFPEGETTATLSLEIADDDVFEAAEQFALSLQDPSDNASVGDQSTTTITIDADEPARFAFQDPSYTVKEGDGTLEITINRLDETETEATVFVSSEEHDLYDPDAKLWDDYRFSQVNVTFAEGETSKTVSLHVEDDWFDEPDEFAWLRLSVTLEDGSEDILGRSKLTIEDNDEPPLAASGFVNELDESEVDNERRDTAYLSDDGVLRTYLDGSLTPVETSDIFDSRAETLLEIGIRDLNSQVDGYDDLWVFVENKEDGKQSLRLHQSLAANADNEGKFSTLPFQTIDIPQFPGEEEEDLPQADPPGVPSTGSEGGGVSGNGRYTLWDALGELFGGSGGGPGNPPPQIDPSEPDVPCGEHGDYLSVTEGVHQFSQYGGFPREVLMTLLYNGDLLNTIYNEVPVLAELYQLAEAYGRLTPLAPSQELSESFFLDTVWKIYEDHCEPLEWEQAAAELDAYLDSVERNAYAPFHDTPNPADVLELNRGLFRAVDELEQFAAASQEQIETNDLSPNDFSVQLYKHDTYYLKKLSDWSATYSFMVGTKEFAWNGIQFEPGDTRFFLNSFWNADTPDQYDEAIQQFGDFLDLFEQAGRPHQEAFQVVDNMLSAAQEFGVDPASTQRFLELAYEYLNLNPLSTSASSDFFLEQIRYGTSDTEWGSIVESLDAWVHYGGEYSYPGPAPLLKFLTQMLKSLEHTDSLKPSDGNYTAEFVEEWLNLGVAYRGEAWNEGYLNSGDESLEFGLSTVFYADSDQDIEDGAAQLERWFEGIDHPAEQLQLLRFQTRLMFLAAYVRDSEYSDDTFDGLYDQYETFRVEFSSAIMELGAAYARLALNGDKQTFSTVVDSEGDVPHFLAALFSSSDQAVTYDHDYWEYAFSDTFEGSASWEIGENFSNFLGVRKSWGYAHDENPIPLIEFSTRLLDAVSESTTLTTEKHEPEFLEALLGVGKSYAALNPEKNDSFFSSWLNKAWSAEDETQLDEAIKELDAASERLDTLEQRLELLKSQKALLDSIEPIWNAKDEPDWLGGGLENIVANAAQLAGRGANNQLESFPNLINLLNEITTEIGVNYEDAILPRVALAVGLTESILPFSGHILNWLHGNALMDDLRASPYYMAGIGFGISSGVVLGAASPANLSKVIQALDLASDAEELFDMGQSLGNLASGEGDIGDIFTLFGGALGGFPSRRSGSDVPSNGSLGIINEGDAIVSGSDQGDVIFNNGYRTRDGKYASASGDTRGLPSEQAEALVSYVTGIEKNTETFGFFSTCYA